MEKYSDVEVWKFPALWKIRQKLQKRGCERKRLARGGGG